MKKTFTPAKGWKEYKVAASNKAKNDDPSHCKDIIRKELKMLLEAKIDMNNEDVDIENY